jgi:cellulose synthase/poly-beta-1,6-N-acetylglucosamine synthase-like glycosyltransferase
MLIFLLYLFGILFLFHGLYQIWKYLITISSLENSKNEIIKNKIKNKIFVFVPVLHEEKNIKYILTNLLDQEYEKNLYQICVITTEKEYLNSSNHPNTVDLLNELKSRNINSDRLIHFHYPNKSGFKADQLRFAFDQIRKIKTDLEISNSFFLLLDADSLIDGNIISRFNSQIQDGIDLALD